MQSANLTSSPQALSRSEKPQIVAGSEGSTHPVSKLEPGQRIQGIVQEQLSPGLYKVQVAGQTLQMQLPGQLQTGKLLELQVVSNAPRLTFSLFASTNPIATREQISPTSRMLANLAELPLTRTFIESTGSKAVLQASVQGINSSQLAAALRDALANSGLFYESHQAQWVRGERSTAQLLIEPQNLLLDRHRAATGETQASDSLSAALFNAQQGKAAMESATPVAKDLLALVQQQLHTLETHQLTWVGEVWPEQQMQWEIQGEPEHQAASADSRQWSTEMELALPRLGDVHIRLAFSKGEVKLNLQAANPESVALLNRRLSELHRAMSDAGVPLTSALIEKNDTE